MADRSKEYTYCWTDKCTHQILYLWWLRVNGVKRWASDGSAGDSSQVRTTTCACHSLFEKDFHSNDYWVFFPKIESRIIACSRWTELTETLKFHLSTATIACAASEFRMLNGKLSRGLWREDIIKSLSNNILPREMILKMFLIGLSCI